MRTSLTIRPLWLFLGVVVVMGYLCLPVKSYAAPLTDTATINFDILNTTMEHFENATQEWQSIFTKYAKELFWILVPIGMVWRFGQIALKGEGLTEALAELVRFTIFIGFYYWLLENGTQITQAIVHSMEKIAGTAAHTSDSLNPSSILNLGISNFVNILYNNYKGFSFNTTHDSTMLFNIATGMIFVCLCAVVAIRVLLAILAVWFLMYVGIFILGFGSTSWTSDMAINYFRTVLVASIRLATIILIVGVCQSVIEDISPSTQSNNAYSPNNFLMMLELIVTAMMMYLLIKTIPELLASLAKGILGSNTHQSNPANAYANALMNGYYAGGGGGGSRTVANIREAEQRTQQLAETLMAQHDAAKAEERARAAKVAYPKAGSTANNSPTTSSARTYIVENMSEKEKEAMYHIPASQIYIPPPGYIGDRSDVGGPA